MATATQPSRQVTVRNGAGDAFEATDREVLICGPAGTGKTRACLEKVYQCVTDHPLTRALIVRKTRVSLTQSALVTWDTEVLPPGVAVFRRSEQEYRFGNGSVVCILGMGDAQERERIKSSQFDIAYVQEATELVLDDWELILSRLRNGAMPYQQLLGDCNPGAPTHWLKQRCDQGGCRMIHSRHQDNPALWQNGDWTDRGLDYLDTLRCLTGIRRARLLEGRWCAAEGMVYDGFDAAVHIIPAFAVLAEWPRFRVWDFGYTNPLVVQWWASDPDGRMYLYRELYVTETLVEDAAAHVQALSEGERIAADVCDHDAEARATLEKRGYRTLAAFKGVQQGIQAVTTRLRAAGDGKPRLFFVAGCGVRRDPRLDEKHLPTATTEEIEGYVWDVRDGKPTKEEPVKRDDHGMDAMRYAVCYADGLGRREMGVA